LQPSNGAADKSRLCRGPVSERFSLAKLGKNDEAITAFDRTIYEDRDNAQAYHQKGFTVIESWQVRDAIPAFDQSITLKPGYAQFIFMIKAFALLKARTVVRKHRSLRFALNITPTTSMPFITRELL